MNEDFAPFELAVKLKEKGYPQHITEEAYITDNYGEDEYDTGDRLPIPLIPDYMDYVASPTISQVLKWLRKEKKIHIVCPFYKDKGFYYYVQRIGNAARIVSSFGDSDDCFDTYEAAAIAGIEYVLDNFLVMKREEETTHPCYKPIRKTKKHIAEEAKRFSFLYPSESKEMFFIYGAEWADRTMLDRACEWMNKVFFQNPFLTKKGIVSGKYDTMEEFITAFRQAMEGGVE